VNRLLIAVDSVGIDPLGVDRPESVYAGSRFLFPRGYRGGVARVPGGVLVETDVTGGRRDGAVECALTYTSIFTGTSTVAEHGLVQALGMRERLLKDLVARRNLFRLFERSCLANAIFPAHLTFFGSSHVEDLVPPFDRAGVAAGLRFRGAPVLAGRPKHGFAELFTLAEINQNIFVHAAREADVPLRTWDDVRHGEALTSTLTHELESDFTMDFFGQPPLPPRTVEEGASILASLARAHDFVFYKFQLADLVSHTGRLDLARSVFDRIERFVESIVRATDAMVVVTSDHGHLEQLESHRGHPKSTVPTWCFRGGCDPDLLATPQGIHAALTS
jgi:hypothetical protein